MMQDMKCYFSDIKNIRPVHYDCVVGELTLPWTGTTILCYRDTAGTMPMYFPEVKEPYHYAREMFLRKSCVEQGYFTEEDYNDYCLRCEARFQESELEIKESENRIAYCYLELRELDELFADKCNYYGRNIDIGLYGLTCYNGICRLVKYKDIDMKSRYWWNEDKDFDALKFESPADAFTKFYEIAKEQ